MRPHAILRKEAAVELGNPWGASISRGARHRRGSRLRDEIRRSDAVTRSGLGWSVAASVVATALTSYWGASRMATLGGAAAFPLIASVFTTRRSQDRGLFRLAAIGLLSIAALGITVTGFTLPELAVGKSLVADRPATFVPLSGDCGNGADDDGDGLVDGADPGCRDGNEVEGSAGPPRPECDNGSDDDGDGLVDGADPGCRDGNESEASVDPVPAECGNGADDDGDGLVDGADPGCRDGNEVESSADPPPPECDNEADDDGDGLVDQADPGCQTGSFEADPVGAVPAPGDGEHVSA
jgi:hypothetical protein